MPGFRHIFQGWQTGGQLIPQVAENNTLRLMDVTGECPL
jgi:hypothetical protein